MMNFGHSMKLDNTFPTGMHAGDPRAYTAAGKHPAPLLKAYEGHEGHQKIVVATGDGIGPEIMDSVLEIMAAANVPIEYDKIEVGDRCGGLPAMPETFDVMVTLNSYGDIISDIASQIAGPVGLAGSANIGHQMAMFEAVHGSAPDILFIGWHQRDRDPEVIENARAELAKDDFKLAVITNRGVKVYPGGMPETFCTDSLAMSVRGQHRPSRLPGCD